MKKEEKERRIYMQHEVIWNKMINVMNVEIAGLVHRVTNISTMTDLEIEAATQVVK